MTQQPDEAIRRRPDGSIDTGFYARRAARLRSAAGMELLARIGRSLVRCLATLRRIGAATRSGLRLPYW